MLLLRALLLCVLLASVVSAQVTSSTNPKVPLTSSDTTAAAIPAGGVSIPIQFTADPAPDGGDFFDIVSSHPQAVISLILPGGAEINSANAQAQGFSFEILTTPDEDSFIEPLFALPGTHTVIGLPPSAPPGTYRIKIDGTAVTGNEAVVASYYSSSSVRAAAVTDAGTYRIGDTVIVSAIIRDGSTPLTGATVSASVGDVSQAVASVNLLDSGQYDEAPGDGIYTGSFTAGQAGEFTAAITATGTSSTGMSFSRTASTNGFWAVRSCFCNSSLMRTKGWFSIRGFQEASMSRKNCGSLLGKLHLQISHYRSVNKNELEDFTVAMVMRGEARKGPTEWSTQPNLMVTLACSHLGKVSMASVVDDDVQQKRIS